MGYGKTGVILPRHHKQVNLLRSGVDQLAVCFAGWFRNSTTQILWEILDDLSVRILFPKLRFSNEDVGEMVRMYKNNALHTLSLNFSFVEENV